MKPGRIPCEVLTCRRTAPADRYAPGTRIICGKCARLASPEARKAYSVAARALHRLGDDERFASPNLLDQAHRAKHLAWERLVAEANEAKAGLS